MMGRSSAFLPVDRRYTRTHLWAARVDAGHRFGFSAYAVKLLGEVRHLEWSVAPGAIVEQGRAIGYVEASKATSDLYAPLAGRLVAINPDVPARPSLVNTDPYDSGWLVTMSADAVQLLSPEEYLAYLETTWPLAQRLLKGQPGKGDRGEGIGH